MKSNKKIIIYTVSGILLVISLIIMLLLTDSEITFEERMELLKESVFDSEEILNIYSPENAFDKEHAYVVFISLCDIKTRAIVLHEVAPTLLEAWEKAEESAKQYIEEKNYDPKWIKVDVVDSIQKVKYKALQKTIKKSYNEFYRKGIAFDKYFKTAVLEAEINGNKFIDYKETDQINIDTLNAYLRKLGKSTIEKIPSELITFTCVGFLCDENNEVYKLNGYGDNEGLDYGRRSYEVDKNTLKDVMLSSSYWLADEVEENGKFIYGYYPTYDKKFTAYNNLRHATSILPFIWSYELTEDDAFKILSEKTLNYMLNEIKEKSPDVSYLVDRTEIKLGGNGVAIVTIDSYMNTFGKDEKLVDICKKLGEGILELQNEDGSYYHVLNTDFSRKEEYRTVYYDGEATYALSVLYKMTGEEKWLNAAKKSIEYFIENDYTKHKDHWVAYAVNEVTKYVDDERYYEFGLKNLQVNMKTIYNQKTPYHTYMELLMAGFEMYDRMIEKGIKCEYLEEFDEQFFMKTIQHRAEHMLNCFFYPEYAMYLKNPEAILGTFGVRHDGYRIRIDDVSHFIAGYYHYYEVYDKVQQYMN